MHKSKRRVTRERLNKLSRLCICVQRVRRQCGVDRSRISSATEGEHQWYLPRVVSKIQPSSQRKLAMTDGGAKS